MSVPDSLKDMVEELTQDLNRVIGLIDVLPPQNSGGSSLPARSDSC